MRTPRRFMIQSLCALSATVFAAAATGGASRIAPPPGSADVDPASLRPALALLDRKMQMTPIIGTTTVTASTVNGFAGAGKPVTMPRGEALAIVPLNWLSEGAVPPVASAAASEADLSTLHFTDGSMLMGRPDTNINDKSSPDALAWHHLEFGRTTVKLDEISRIVFKPLSGDAPNLNERATASKGGSDLLLLRNNDRLEGFLTGFEVIPDTETRGYVLAAKIEVDKKPVTIPLPRVRVIALANPPVKPAGARLWCTDGSILAADTLVQEEPAAYVITQKSRRGDERVRVNAEYVTTVAFDAAAVVPLATLTPTAQTSDRRWTPPIEVQQQRQPLDARDILIPGAMTVTWPAPKGASSFSASMVLPEDSRSWADFELSLTPLDAKGASLPGWSGKFTADQPSHAASTPLTREATHLRLTITPGPRGPVHTRVWLRRAMFVVDTGTGK